MSEVKSKPDGYHTLTPYLIVRNAAQAMDFYKKAFGAEELFRLEMGEDMIGHAEMQIGDSRFMLASEFPDRGFVGPQSLGGTSVSLLLYVDKVDEFAKNAVAAGMETLRPIEDQFYGDRMGTFKDPYGHVWSIATHIKDVTPEEMKEKMKEMQ